MSTRSLCRYRPFSLLELVIISFAFASFQSACSFSTTFSLRKGTEKIHFIIRNYSIRTIPSYPARNLLSNNIMLCNQPDDDVAAEIITMSIQSNLESSSDIHNPIIIHSNDDDSTTDIQQNTSIINSHRTVTILQRSRHHIVALKPPGVVCHHSGWTGSRSKKTKQRGNNDAGIIGKEDEPEVPMLQRVRDALHDIELRSNQDNDVIIRRRRVNLVHRLDRGASGALLLTYAESEDENEQLETEVGGNDGDHDDEDKNDDDDDDEKEEEEREKINVTQKKKKKKRGVTSQLIHAMQSPKSIKTYIALVRGEGILCGEDLTKRGWFEVNRPIKDESGELKEASTYFHFVAGQAESGRDRPRICVVLARPKQGRWHQIRRHLNGLSHPIIGDSSHGVSKVNREWRVERNFPGERIALHLGRIQLIPTESFPQGLDVTAPLLEDMLDMLRAYAPEVLAKSLPILQKEGLVVDATRSQEYEVGKWNIPEVLQQPKPVYDDDDVDILHMDEHFVVVSKPPVVVAHHSSWTSPKRDNLNLRWREKIPMLQRVRAKTGRRVNLVHRLDRGASGCLLFTFAESDTDVDTSPSCRVTKSLIESMQHKNATKTYIAFCDGLGVWNDVNYLEKKWFTFRNPVKDDQGNTIEDAETEFYFVASAILPPVDDASITINNDMEGRKVSIVLARPKSGRWHQIRQHLASGTIGHAILGDSTHGRSRTNRIWKKKRHLIKERVCLHLSRLQLPPTEYSPEGIDVICPLAQDLTQMLGFLPTEFLELARPIIFEETGTVI